MNQAEVIDLLERSAADPPRLTEDEIVTLMKRVLWLELCYFPAVQIAVRQGRWRGKAHPAAYVRKAAEREAIKMGLADDPREEIHLMVPRKADGSWMGVDEYIDKRTAEEEGPVKQDGVWRASDPTDEWEYYSDQGEPISGYEAIVSRLPDHLRRKKAMVIGTNKLGAMIEEEIETPDWVKIGELAGLDDGEILALCFRVDGYSRDRAMALQRSDRDRKDIQAAWKRLDRKWHRVVETITSEISST